MIVLLRVTVKISQSTPEKCYLILIWLFVTINTDTYEQLVFELRRIGNNINQIARYQSEPSDFSGPITRIE